MTAERLRLIETIAELSGDQMATVLRISPQSWSDYKAGRRKLPTDIARELKRLYGCSLDWLYTGDEANNLPLFTRKVRALEEIRRTAS